MTKIFIFMACFINFQLLCMDTKEDTTDLSNCYAQAIISQANQIKNLLGLLKIDSKNRLFILNCIAYNLESIALLMQSQNAIMGKT